MNRSIFYLSMLYRYISFEQLINADKGKYDNNIEFYVSRESNLSLDNPTNVC